MYFCANGSFTRSLNQTNELHTTNDWIITFYIVFDPWTRVTCLLEIPFWHPQTYHCYYCDKLFTLWQCHVSSAVLTVYYNIIIAIFNSFLSFACKLYNLQQNKSYANYLECFNILCYILMYFLLKKRLKRLTPIIC